MGKQLVLMNEILLEIIPKGHSSICNHKFICKRKYDKKNRPHQEHLTLLAIRAFISSNWWWHKM
nr:hypothetical protein [Mycoplasmopsis bovis]